MPRLSIWLIRAALIHLGIGFTLGGLLLWNKGIPLHPALWKLLPLHMEMLLTGWTVQLTMGVAYWILPRWNTQRRRVPLVFAAFILINLGVLMTGSAHWFDAPSVLFIMGRTLEVLAAAAFAVHAWPRIKPLGGP
jgi:hypothetical protein